MPSVKLPDTAPAFPADEKGKKPPQKPKKNPDVAALRARFTAGTGKPVTAGAMAAKMLKLQRLAFVGERLPMKDKREAVDDVLAGLGLKRG